MVEELSCPKERFLVEIFESGKQKTKDAPAAGFDAVLNAVQSKIEKKQLDSLLAAGEKEADETIDNASPQESVELLKQSIDVIRPPKG